MALIWLKHDPQIFPNSFVFNGPVQWTISVYTMKFEHFPRRRRNDVEKNYTDIIHTWTLHGLHSLAAPIFGDMVKYLT